MQYAELHCLSNFTFLRGASAPNELVQRASELGYKALALTDECSLAGVVVAHQVAKQSTVPIKLIIGSEFKLDDGLRLVLLATDREGYGNLAELITTGRCRASKGSYRLTRRDLESGMPGCLALWLAGRDAKSADAIWVDTIFKGRSWIAVELLLQADDGPYLSRLSQLSRETGMPLVASGDVHMHERVRRPLQDTLTAIRLKRPLSECGYALFPNGERHLRPIGKLQRIYPAELLAETVAIAGRCNFSLDSLHYEYPEEMVPAGETPTDYLRRLTYEGFLRRFPQSCAKTDVGKLKVQVEHELKLIAEMKVEAFFLTVYDIVQFARGRGILCQGRGSAANSVVCYCLGITEVSPTLTPLLFERFISKERNEPPDIDVDFEHERREEVMQYIYSKYGRDRAGLTATTICYRPRSAIRDVGKALGMAAGQLDHLAKSMVWWDGGQAVESRFRESGLAPASPIVKHLITLTSALVGFPRHLSQHTGGFVISRGPLSRLVPIENAAMADRTVIQWNKDDLDALGLLKVDVLALGMLSAIRRALAMLSNQYRRPFHMEDIPREDPRVYEMIGHADTVGVFQIESRAQMSMLPRLRPKQFYDLVIEVAIVRPGPIQGGMVHPYLRQREGLEKADYPSNAVEEVLSRTLGVPIFQEQAMQLAVVAAGFTPGEADQLRRSMAAWRRKGGLERFRGKLIDGMRAHGYTDEFAERLYRQILGFGEYGFPESHAASFALLVYVSAWLKCFHPAAFTCALLNSQPMGFYAPSQLIQDARRHGVKVRPVDATTSEWECSLEYDAGAEPALRLGLCLVKGLSQAGAERLVTARNRRAFKDADDLASRATLDEKDLQALAASDALAAISGHRRNALWQVKGIEIFPPLLTEAPVNERAPRLISPSEGENLVADYTSIGLTLGRHPLALLRPQLDGQHMMTAAQLKTLPHGRRTRVTGLVTGRQRPGTASGVTFVTLEDETGMINVIVWRDLAEKQRRELLRANLLTVYGQLERQGEVIHLIAGRLRDQTMLLGKLMTKSRDFH